MVNLERAWARWASRFPGRQLPRMRPQVFTNNFQLTTGAQVTNQNVTFPAGALILGIMAGAFVTGAAATQVYRRGLDLFTLASSMQSDGRSLIGPAEALAASVFGEEGMAFPPIEIYLPEQTTLVYAFTNLSTSTINVSLAHHAMVPGDVS